MGATFVSGMALGFSLGIAMGVGIVAGALLLLIHIATAWAGRQ